MFREPHMNDNHWNAILEFNDYLHELERGTTEIRRQYISKACNVCGDLMNYSHLVCENFNQLDLIIHKCCILLKDIR